jgi:hypothetical protein
MDEYLRRETEAILGVPLADWVGAGDPTGTGSRWEPAASFGVSATKLGAWLPVSHEALCDSTDHVCTSGCPPVWTPPPVPFRHRVRYAIRRAARAVTGLRIVHKDRIRDEDDDE